MHRPVSTFPAEKIDRWKQWEPSPVTGVRPPVALSTVLRGIDDLYTAIDESARDYKDDGAPFLLDLPSRNELVELFERWRVVAFHAREDLLRHIDKSVREQKEHPQ